MASYAIRYDEQRGLLHCHMRCVLSASDLSELYTELDGAMAEAKARGPIRMLWDHRGFAVLNGDVAAALCTIAKRHYRPGDRCAILVSSSLDKAQGRMQTTEEAALFISENAALTWLRVGIAQAA